MKSVSREEAIELLKSELSKFTTDSDSICKIAGEKNIFCKGFKHYTPKELFERYDWLTKNRHIHSREELEKLANQWQLARQEVNQCEFACDAQTAEHDTCLGWDEFSNQDLEKFIKEIAGQDISIL